MNIEQWITQEQVLKKVRFIKTKGDKLHLKKVWNQGVKDGFALSDVIKLFRDERCYRGPLKFPFSTSCRVEILGTCSYLKAFRKLNYKILTKPESIAVHRVLKILSFMHEQNFETFQLWYNFYESVGGYFELG